MCGVHAGPVDAGGAAEGGLRDVGIAAVTELLLLALSLAQLRVPDKHAETL